MGNTTTKKTIKSKRWIAAVVGVVGLAGVVLAAVFSPALTEQIKQAKQTQQTNNAETTNQSQPTVIKLKPNDKELVALGQNIYQQHCAACHGVNLGGQPNWTQRDANGFMPAPPHDETGHTWHHPDTMLFYMTKYGIEQLIGRDYPNNMPNYENILSDREIVAVLSYIKSTWSPPVQAQHDQINQQSKHR